MGILKFLKFIIFPPHCAFCGVPSLEETGPCSRCSGRVPLITPPVCERCGAEIARCSCKGKRLGFDRCVGVVRYEGLGAKAVCEMKRTGEKSTIERFSQYIAAAVMREYSEVCFDMVTFVPMHSLDEQERGFNQAAMLAKELSGIIGVDCKQTLIKNRRTKPQKSCAISQRYANLLGAFDVCEKVNGKAVLIVDDIRTSGATLSECAKTLLLSGAQCVCAAVFAITCEDQKKDVKV